MEIACTKKNVVLVYEVAFKIILNFKKKSRFVENLNTLSMIVKELTDFDCIRIFQEAAVQKHC